MITISCNLLVGSNFDGPIFPCGKLFPFPTSIKSGSSTFHCECLDAMTQISYARMYKDCWKLPQKIGLKYINYVLGVEKHGKLGIFKSDFYEWKKALETQRELNKWKYFKRKINKTPPIRLHSNPHKICPKLYALIMCKEKVL